jgi:hypothetical protein
MIPSLPNSLFSVKIGSICHYKNGAKNCKCPLEPIPMKNCITYSQAADALAVDERTVKRWMRRPDARDALLAARDGARWRIPWPADICWEEVDGTCRKAPANVFLWEKEARRNLNVIGVYPPDGVERALEQLAKQSELYHPEVRRLYLAACAKALSRGRMTGKTKLGIDLLYHAARKILSEERQRFGIETLKHKFPCHLHRYWPRKRDFEWIKDAHTLADIEKQRRRLDFTRAVRQLRRRGKNPTTENLRPLLHKGWLSDFNDTNEKHHPPVGDRRQPQLGLSLYEFRQRYPLSKNPWRNIIGKIYGVLAEVPGSNQALDDGHTLEDESQVHF